MPIRHKQFVKCKGTLGSFLLFSSTLEKWSEIYSQRLRENGLVILS